MPNDADPKALGRREFLKLMGGAIGGAVLLPYGCSDRGSGGNDTPLPNGYRFYRIIGSDQTAFPDLLQITPGLMINDRNRILFYGQNRASDAYGLYEIQLDLAAAEPKAVGFRTLAATGGRLTPSGRQQVGRILRADTNAAGQTAILLDTLADGPGAAKPDALASVYIDSGDGRLERIVGFNDRAPDGGRYGGAFGDLSLHDNADLLLVAQFSDQAGDNAQALFALPGAQPSRGQIQLRTGTALQGRASALVSSLGLVDLNDAGNYTIQTNVHTPQWRAGTGAAPEPAQAALLQGRVMQGLGAAPTNILSAPMPTGLSSDIQGAVILGPRAGAEDAAAWVTHMPNPGPTTATEEQVLYYKHGGRVREVARAGGHSPIHALSAPVLSRSGLLFYLQVNTAAKPGLELKVLGDGEPQTILAQGDEVAGKTLSGIMYGFHAQQADIEGRIVVYAEFADGDTAILLGVPA